MNPLISIVIANYNYGRFLEEAIQSVISQDMGDKVELIVCDAASTDNSVEIIRKYEKYISWWCSEPDGGQSAAFNKGFSHAHGRFLTWLNADDVLLPGSLKKFEIAVAKWPMCEWFVGGCFWLDPEMKIFKCGRARHMSRYRARHGVVNVCGPSSFFSRRLFQTVGGMDERFKYTMDTDLWRRFAKAGIRLHHIPDYVWCFRVHEESKTSHKFITGKGSDSFASEGMSMNFRYGITPFRNKIGSLLNRLLRLATGAYLRSYIDTRRYKGKSIDVIGR